MSATPTAPPPSPRPYLTARHDVLAHLETVQGPQRQTTVLALRSLFGRAKKNGTIFKNPTSRIRVGQREEGVTQPLERSVCRPQAALRVLAP